jgi:hypothetical protein
LQSAPFRTVFVIHTAYATKIQLLMLCCVVCVDMNTNLSSKTVDKPITIEPPCAVVPPILAAGLPQIKTVAEPLTIVSGGPTQTRTSPTTAAGNFPIKTVGAPHPIIRPPTMVWVVIPELTLDRYAYLSF